MPRPAASTATGPMASFVTTEEFLLDETESSDLILFACAFRPTLLDWTIDVKLIAATETIPTVSRISRNGFEKFKLKRDAIDVLVKRIKPRTGDMEDLLCS